MGEVLLLRCLIDGFFFDLLNHKAQALLFISNVRNASFNPGTDRFPFCFDLSSNPAISSRIAFRCSFNASI